MRYAVFYVLYVEIKKNKIAILYFIFLNQSEIKDVWFIFIL